MIKTTIEELAKDVSGVVEAARHERVLITDHGKPLVLLVGVEDKDEEQLELEASTEFWQMIRESRKSPTVKLKDVEAELLRGE